MGTPKEYAVAWWGDESYPKGQDWQALLKQFSRCQSDTRRQVLDDILAILKKQQVDESVITAVNKLISSGHQK